MEAVTSAGIGLWALVALAQTGPAVSVPVRVEFEAPPGCSDAEAFFAGVLTRARHVHRAHPGETAVRLTVHVSRAGARVHGELRVNEAGGEAETRRVDGATCAEVVQVLSLTAALAIDPTAEMLAPAAPEKPAAAPSPVRATPSAAATPPPRATPAAAPGPAVVNPPPAAPTSPTAPPAPVITLPASAPPETPPTVSPAPVPAPPPTVALAQAPAPITAEPRREPPRSSGPRFGASLVAARVLASSLGLGASFWSRLGITTREGLTPSVTLTALYLPGDFFRSGDNLGIGWMALAATGCPGWAPGGRVRVEPCARITAGILSATDHSVNTPRSVDRWWGSAGALVRLTAPVGGGLMLDVDGGVDLPFVTRRFITSTVTMTNQPVGATTSISPTLSVGLSHSL